MAIVYILKDERGRIYIGSTTDLMRRLAEHSRGHTASTKKLVNFRVVWQKELTDLKLARDAERKIKKWKSRKMVELLIDGTVDI